MDCMDCEILSVSGPATSAIAVQSCRHFTDAVLFKVGISYFTLGYLQIGTARDRSCALPRAWRQLIGHCPDIDDYARLSCQVLHAFRGCHHHSSSTQNLFSSALSLLADNLGRDKNTSSQLAWTAPAPFTPLGPRD